MMYFNFDSNTVCFHSVLITNIIICNLQFTSLHVIPILDIKTYNYTLILVSIAVLIQQLSLL